MPPLLDIPPSGSFNAWSQGFEFPDLLLAICKREQSGELKFMSSEAEKDHPCSRWGDRFREVIVDRRPSRPLLAAREFDSVRARDRAQPVRIAREAIRHRSRRKRRPRFRTNSCRASSVKCARSS